MRDPSNIQGEGKGEGFFPSFSLPGTVELDFCSQQLKCIDSTFECEHKDSQKDKQAVLIKEV